MKKKKKKNTSKVSGTGLFDIKDKLKKVAKRIIYI
jgi:hypothetical protein